jgi:hypothetical protein
MVVNGAAHESGSEKEAVEALIDQAASDRPDRPAVSLTEAQGGGVAVEIGAAPFQGPPAAVLLVLFDRKHETAVSRGENAGQTLTEYQVVRGIKEIGRWRGSELHIVLDAEAAKGADGGAVLVQRPGAGPILGAATMTLATAQ